jgi:hypothetical protein
MDKFYIPKVYFFDLKPEEEMLLYWDIFFPPDQQKIEATGSLTCPICHKQHKYQVGALPYCNTLTRTLMFSYLKNDPKGVITVPQQDWFKEALRQAEIMFQVCQAPTLNLHNLFILKKDIEPNICEIGAILRIGTASRSTKKFNQAFDRIIRLKAFM